MKFDYLIVGAGLFGSVFAHELRKAGRRVLVLDRREHVGGNIFTREVEGIQVHVYGAHIFHTSNEQVWQYVNRLARFNHYQHHVKARYRDKVYSLPVNLATFYEVAGCTTPAEAEEYLRRVRVPCDNPRNLEEWALSQIGREIYDILIRGYTAKQWMRDPRDLPAAILRRLPLRLRWDDNYYEDCYQGIPVGGYTQIAEQLLEGCEVRLGTDFFGLGDWRAHARKLVYTGPVDRFFDYRFGALEYRTLEFETEVLEQQDFQGASVVNYTEEAVPYTRIIEHKHFEFGRQPRTVITREYPVAWRPDSVPYYPVNDDRNNALYRQYQALARSDPDVVIGGRLGGFRYYDMDQTIASALTQVRKELS